MFKSFVAIVLRPVMSIARRVRVFGLLWIVTGVLIPPAHAQAPAPVDEPRQPAAEELYRQVKDALDAKDYGKVILLLQQAAERNPEDVEYQTLLAQAHYYWAKELEGLFRWDEAIREYEAAYAIDNIHRRRNAAIDLSNIGTVYQSLGQQERALAYFQQALPIYREVKDRQDEATSLNNIGLSYNDLSQYERALVYFQQALPIRREVKDRQGEATTLNSIGVTYYNLSQYERALEYYQQALLIRREVKDRAGEAATLNNIGAAYDILNQYGRALEHYQQALPIFEEIKDRRGEATTLGNIGMTYYNLSQYERALGYFQQALPIRREVKDRQGEATTLNNISTVYLSLSQYEQALEYYRQALPIFQEIKNLQGEAATLTNIGSAYTSLNQPEQALEYYQQALPILQEIKDRQGEATLLHNIGWAHSGLSQYERALEYYQQALPIRREVRDRAGEAATLNNIGAVYDSLSQYERALEYYQQALPIFQEIKDRRGEGSTLSSLAGVLKAQKQPELAIFYGKEAVNVYQSIRADIRGLDKYLQKDYIKSHEETYRMLAGLLIEQNRLGEAMQVINLLKQEEYLNAFAATAAAVQDTTLLDERATLTTREAHWHDLFEEAGNRLDQTGARWRKLNDKPKRTPAEEEELQAAERENQEAQSRFLALLKEIEQDFAGPLDATDHIERVADAQDLQDALRQLGHHSVALYTLAGEKQLDLLLVTPDSLIARRVDISEEELNRKIRLFRQVLQNPVLDPRPMGQELYDVLLKPVLGDLEASGAENLMWSLDGALRYIPVAALYDGKQGQYLAEQYRNSLFTPASLIRLERAPHPSWQGLGLGVSKPHPGFSALQSVPRELKGIFRVSDAAQPASPVGVLQGRILLDEQFTRAHLLEALKEGFPLVHIASHFTFRPGDANDTFLLLGDGDHLTLAEIQALPDSLLAGVDLLTLSACETADGGADANGREVENVAVLAQRKGADAVLASLWPVSDEGTATLMQNFYRQRQGHPEQGKAEALREAQLQLMQGSYASLSEAERGVRVVQSETQPKDKTPLFTVDPKAPFAHPYFWAPFILMGNWR